MKIRKTTAKLMAVLLAGCMLATTALAYDGIYTDKEGNISYSHYEQGLYSNGGYTIDKVSHPTLGAKSGLLPSCSHPEPTGPESGPGWSANWFPTSTEAWVHLISALVQIPCRV